MAAALVQCSGWAERRAAISTGEASLKCWRSRLHTSPAPKIKRGRQGRRILGGRTFRLRFCRVGAEQFSRAIRGGAKNSGQRTDGEMSQIEELQGRIAAGARPDRAGAGPGLGAGGGGRSGRDRGAMRRNLRSRRPTRGRGRNASRQLAGAMDGESGWRPSLRIGKRQGDDGDASASSTRRCRACARPMTSCARSTPSCARPTRPGVGEPHLINKAMMAELEALARRRAADRAEAEAVYERSCRRPSKPPGTAEEARARPVGGSLMPEIEIEIGGRLSKWPARKAKSIT